MNGKNTSNEELRKWAWNGLWKGRWFWKLLATGLIFGIIAQAAQTTLNFFFTVLGGVSNTRWMNEIVVALKNGQTAPEVTFAMIAQVVIVFVMSIFAALLFAGIASYAMASVTLNCARGGTPDWLTRAFDGFKRPLSLMWLYIRLGLIYFGWTLLAVAVSALVLVPLFLVIPGVPEPVAAGVICVVTGTLAACAAMVPFYRYRFAFLVFADNPDLSANETLARTRELMRGNMRRSFVLDCSYWRPLALLLLVMLVPPLVALSFGAAFERSAAFVAILALSLIGSVLFLMAAVWVVVFHIKMGQTGLFLELTDRAVVG